MKDLRASAFKSFAVAAALQSFILCCWAARGFSVVVFPDKHSDMNVFRVSPVSF